MTKYLFLIIFAGIGITTNAQNTNIIEKLDSAKTAEGFLINNAGNTPFSYVDYFNFQIPDSSGVGIIIVNVYGDTIKTLYNGKLPGGYYKARWNFKDENGKDVPSGIYFFRLNAHCKTIKTLDMDFVGTFKWLFIK